MLIIGATEDDARAFVGIRPGSQPGDPVADDRPSRAVPDDLWPPGETWTGFFATGGQGWPAGDREFDGVVVTRGAQEAARLAHDAREPDLRAWCAKLTNASGWLYIEPAATHA